MNLNKLEKQGFKYVCGVDEAGRGPLAGPLSLSFFVVSIKDYKKILSPLLKLGLNDSKKIKEEKREELFNEMSRITSSRKFVYRTIRDLDQRAGSRVKPGTTCLDADFINSMSSASQIDKNGISKSYQNLIKRMLKKVPKKTYFLLDGSIKFPENIEHKVIIGGDGIEPVIMAASIVSKVKRDKKMKVISKKHPKYGFETNKGYGTKKHREAIKKFGLSKEHRKSFCKAFTK